jgi:hypothetical protein
MLATLFTLVGAMALSATAAAQVSLNGAPLHSGMNHPNNASPLMVSQADCNAQTTFTFAVTGLAAQKTLSVWASSQGGDCTQQTQRNPGSTQTCYQVLAPFIPNTPPSASVVLTSTAIVGGSGGSGAGGVTGCSDTTAGDAPRKLVLYFLIDEATGNVTDSTKYDIDFDLRGPPPPTNLAPSTFNESSLLVKFCSPPGTTDVAGYKLYCDPSGATGTVSSSTDPNCTLTTTSTTAATTTSTSGAGGSSSTSGVGGSSTDAASSSSSVASSSASGGGTSTCTTSAFKSGTTPTGLVECASVNGITAVEAEAPGFTVGKLGAVAIAAFDNVGNVGVLSTIVCGQTEEVTDFFEGYRSAGGTGGNGCYCHAGRGDVSRLGALAFVLGVALMTLRRNRGVR